jgi:hypothetical protein
MKVIAGIVAVALLATSAMAGEGDAFRSATAGFEITKPTDWHYLTADQNQENLSRVQLSDEEYKEALLKYATVPLVAMVKHAEPFDDLNPSIKVNIKPLGDLKGMAATKILDLLMPQFEALFDGFEVAEGPQEVEVSGLPAGYVRMHYTLRVGNGLEFPTASELWIVPRGDCFFFIGAGTRQDEKTGGRAEIRSILATVRLEPQSSD